MGEERKQAFFGELAPSYAKFTGNTTQDIFKKVVNERRAELNLNSSSVVHDNASGPGTATEVLLGLLEPPAQIIATDYNKEMIDALIKQLPGLPNSERVTPKVVDSANLEMFGDGIFTHSVSNFSLFTVTNAVQSLTEIHRTLAPGGIAMILLWKRFAIPFLLNHAQDFIKGVGYGAQNALPVNGPEYFEKETARRQLSQAGFISSKMETMQVDWFLTESEGSKWNGLHEFMTTTSVAAASTRGWSDEEKAQWPHAVERAMREEQNIYGGVLFQSWVTIVRK